MRTPAERDKHNRRIEQKENYIKRQTRLAQTYGLPAEQPHMFAKHAALNCGNPNCFMCANPRKVDKGTNRKTVQERSFEQSKRHADIDTED